MTVLELFLLFLVHLNLLHLSQPVYFGAVAGGYAFDPSQNSGYLVHQVFVFATHLLLHAQLWSLFVHVSFELEVFVEWLFVLAY